MNFDITDVLSSVHSKQHRQGEVLVLQLQGTPKIFNWCQLWASSASFTNMRRSSSGSDNGGMHGAIQLQEREQHHAKPQHRLYCTAKAVKRTLQAHC
jgi:hypothetical protein